MVASSMITTSRLTISLKPRNRYWSVDAVSALDTGRCSGRHVQQARRASDQDLASGRCKAGRAVMDCGELKCDKLLQCGSVGAPARRGRQTKRFQDFPLVRRQVVVEVCIHVVSTAFPIHCACVLAALRERCATVMSLDFVVPPGR